MPYVHHRQTSIVHGIQHSRHGSAASATASSPLSPLEIAAAGGLSPDASTMAQSDHDVSSSMSPMLSATANSSFSSTLSSNATLTPERGAAIGENGLGSTSQKKLERMHSGSRRHNSSQSRHHNKEEVKTVSEYALHVLFNSFVGQAEEKIKQCCPTPLGPEPQVEFICGPGVDPAFDQLISALGHIASQRPKPLIDSLMVWRKQKSDAANDARAQYQQYRGVPPAAGQMQRRNTEPVYSPSDAQDSSIAGKMASCPSMAARQELVSETERKSTVSIYILCRVLVEVIGQSTLACITLEMEDKLEGIIFSQLRGADPEQLSVAPLKLANWFLFGELLGVMSKINFKSVTDRFIAELERSQRDIVGKVPASRELEGRIELVLAGMKHLRIKTQPEEAWAQSCEFLAALGRYFNRCHGPRLKYAYCQILETLLLPIAATANTELNTARWSEVAATVGQRVSSMLQKPRHWDVAFPMTATILSVSPVETFANQWLQLITPLQPKLRDRYTRATCLQAISRLVWTYLYRCKEPLSHVCIKKLEEVVKLILPQGKRNILSTEASVAEPIIEIIRMIGYRFPDYCFQTIIFPLINADLFMAGKDLKVEQLEPEKMVIGIRAFLGVISALERGAKGRPPFPVNYQSLQAADRLGQTSPVSTVPHRVFPRTARLTSKDECQSRPVAISALGDSTKRHYRQFCEILGKITIICDNAFGGQAVLDEKFNSPAPKTPIAETFNFTRRDDHPGISDQKQGFYELLHVAVQALPRCLSADIPSSSLVNLLCTGTAHVQYNIAESSSLSLKAIARQNHAQPVTIGFARFIFNFDDRYSTMSDGGMLGPGHVENTLKLYVELLQIWIEEVKHKVQEAAGESPNGDKRGMQLDLSGMWAYVEEVEAHGLFFLCSQSRGVRTYAINVLRLVTEFDKALGKDNVRIIRILEDDSLEVLDFNDEHLTVAERSRLQRGIKRSSSQSALIELCGSDISYDTTLWFKIFPNLIRISYARCPVAVTIGRELICSRILQLYKSIVTLADRGPQIGGTERIDTSGVRMLTRATTTPPDVLIEQWKLYLTVACTTLSDSGGQSQAGQQTQQHVRKTSRAVQNPDKITSARTLLKYIVPLLRVGLAAIREAVVTALGSVNINIYKTLLEELQSAVTQCNNEARARIHQRTGSVPRRNRATDILRTEITHVYSLTAHFLREPRIYSDDWILNNLVVYTKDLKLFLMDVEVQMDWEFQKLRRHYCGLMKELFEGINRTNDPSRWMTFEFRKSSFTLMEDWCGFSPNQVQIRQREETMMQDMIRQQAMGEKRTIMTAMEKERTSLRTAALSAMATLCAGPTGVKTDSGVILQFDVRRMYFWIGEIYHTESDRMHAIGRRALKNVITHNQEHIELLDHTIYCCYRANTPKALESYFEVITQVLLEESNYQMPFWKLLAIGIYTLGNEKSEIRSKSANVLRVLEEREKRNSKIQDYDISISDKTKAVYKLAQFEISRRLSSQHSDVAFLIFSEFTLHFHALSSAAQRNMVAAILPWVQSIELQVDPNGGPTAQSYVLLANLVEITVKSSSALHNEVQALWQALATGPHAGNVQLVLDFIMSLCLDRREQNFVEYAKQIVVFLSSTLNGPKVVEFLIQQITPRAMIPNEKRETPSAPEIMGFPYVANLSEAVPMGARQAGFSLGQLSLILLVDLMVSPIQLKAEDVPLLLQVVTVLWDHYTPLVQEQAREMLIHLIHELVISQIEDESTTTAKKSVEDFIECVRKQEQDVIWQYDDGSGKVVDGVNMVPSGMQYLTNRIVNNFEVRYPGIKEQWAKLSLTWATSCPVRHLACRSFQIFRCIFAGLDHTMLGDMLARLSNTIADEDPEIQTFSMEIITTLRTLISKLEPAKLITFPQLFWTMCACLDTINEKEFLEAEGMLEEFLSKLDLSDSIVARLLLEGRPPKWEGSFEGLQPLVYRGLRSSICYNKTLVLLVKLVQFPSDTLVGEDSRLLFATLANFPRFLHVLDQPAVDAATLQTANVLATLAKDHGCSALAHVLSGFCASKYSTGRELLPQLMAAIRDNYFPLWDYKSLVFMMGLLTNSIPWLKVQTLRILCELIPEINMRKPEIASHGADLITPLLGLLQTEFCMHALEVLDHIMVLSGTAMDPHHLRMSVSSASSSAIRKEYERTESLFGISEDSGWGVPMPAKHAEITRANVHAAFYTCQPTENVDVEVAQTPDLEFHADEFHHFECYTPRERADTMMSDEVRGETNIGELVTKLDSLDDFFEETLQSPASDAHSSRTVTDATPDFGDGAQLYDEQTVPILHQSLAHNGHNTSLQNGFADVRPGQQQYVSHAPTSTAMNPAAFRPPLMARPSMHSRSITSPSTPASATKYDFLSDDELDEVFSDGEERGTSNNDGSFFLESVLPRAKSGIRRLTGGRSKDNERQRDLFRSSPRGAQPPTGPNVPQVPEVPSMFLNMMQSPPNSDAL